MLEFSAGLVCLLSLIGAEGHRPSTATKPVDLMPGLGKHHHPVSTRNELAQKFFDQGLLLLYGFNHDHAARSFRRAAELDPQLAMAHWGISLVLGPNYNMVQIEPDQAKSAYEALEKALALAPHAPEHERAYIEALAKRYSPDPNADGKKLALAYSNAMRDLARRYPDDLDAATLFAESVMNRRPWKLWSADGVPAEGTEEVVATLESVIRRNPDHPGANHYYIHAVEASPRPEWALASADRLGGLAPAAGHLVHMPAHIYFRIGDYEAAARANQRAITVDRNFIRNTGAIGVYPMMYYSHNIHFLSAARAMQGRFTDAKQAADQLVAHIAPHVKEMPMLEAWMPLPMVTLIRFRRWDDILGAPPPAAGLPITTAIWRFARSAAHAAQGRLDEADTERQNFIAAKAAIPAETPFSDYNTAQEVLAIAETALTARIALRRNDTQGGLGLYREAVKQEDALGYGEPPDGFLRTREWLGGALLRHGDFAEAEKVFRADLARQPRNGRSLFGLRESLNGQKNETAAKLVDLEFQAAWKHADPAELTIDDL
jgi:tetratricopeptide (TPR) repeat protein